MRVRAGKPARPDPASRPGPQKNLGGAAKSRPQPGKTRVSASRLRCPAYKRKRLVGGHFIPRFLPPTTSPLPPGAAAGRRPRFRRQQPAGARRKAATRTRPPLPSPLRRRAAGFADLRHFIAGRRIWLFPAAGCCPKRWSGRGASPAAQARAHRRMQARVRPPAAAEGLRAWIRPAVHRARRSRSGSVARRCRSYSATTARGQCCG